MVLVQPLQNVSRLTARASYLLIATPKLRDYLAGDLGCEWRELEISNEKHWTVFERDFPAIDVLVNNAGVTGFETGVVPHDPEHATLEDWRAVHRINLDGTFLGCRYAIRAMRKAAKGSIINISSRSGMIGIPAAAAYASSKAAIRNHTKTVALYCAQEGLAIRCNSVPSRSNPYSNVGTDAR